MKHKIYKHKDDGTIYPSNSTSTYDTGTIFITTETAARWRYVHVLVIFNVVDTLVRTLFVSRTTLTSSSRRPISWHVGASDENDGDD